MSLSAYWQLAQGLLMAVAELARVPRGGPLWGSPVTSATACASADSRRSGTRKSSEGWPLSGSPATSATARASANFRSSGTRKSSEGWPLSGSLATSATARASANFRSSVNSAAKRRSARVPKAGRSPEVLRSCASQPTSATLRSCARSISHLPDGPSVPKVAGAGSLLV